jgi:hypothetical protein
MTEAKKNVVAKKDESTELLAMGARPDFLKQGPARGSEEVDLSDITIPRLSIIQDLSPQGKKSKPEYIDGAEVGHLFNTITKELFTGEVMFIPVYFRKEYIIWKLRAKGGGFFGAFNTEQEAVAALPDLEGNANDYEVVDTHVHFVLLVKQGSTKDAPILEEVVLSMSKSQNKKSRELNTMIKLAGGDRFSRIYKLSATEEQNKNGDDYWNYRVSPFGYVSEAMYKRAEETYEAISSGQRKVDHGGDDSDAKQPSKAKAAPKEADFDDEFAV